MGTNPVNGNNGQTNGLRFQPQQPVVSDAVKNAAKPNLKPIKTQPKSREALTNPEKYAKDLAKAQQEQAKMEAAKKEWDAMSDAEKAEKHKKAQEAKANFAKEQEKAARERAERQEVTMADGTKRTGVRKPVGGVIAGAVVKGLMAPVLPFVACDALETKFAELNKDEIEHEVDVTATAGTQASADAEAEAKADYPDIRIVEGNYYDHMDDILGVLGLNPMRGGAHMPEAGMVEGGGYFKSYDGILTRFATSGESTHTTIVEEAGQDAHATLGTQVLNWQRSDYSSSDSPIPQGSKVSIAPTGNPGVRIVSWNNPAANSVSGFALALNKQEGRVYLYPFANESSDNPTNTVNNYYNNVLGAIDGNTTANGYKRVESAKGGAKDSSAPTCAFSYFERNTSGSITNYVVLSDGSTWSQVVETEDYDPNDNNTSFMDNNSGNDLPDQNSPANEAKTYHLR